jgi:hypothetical protein
MRYLSRLIPLVLVVAVCLSLLVGQDDVLERVEVVNREVVVRVFDGGEPVSGLTRKDFFLNENGEPVTITSCREVRRALAPAESPATEAGKPVSGKKRGRLFLFLLWWNEESRDWPKAWEYFLENIFRPGDLIILGTESHATPIKNPQKETETLATFFQKMSEELNRKKSEKTLLIRELERCAKDFHENLSYTGPATSEAFTLNRFKECYRGILEEYRLRRLRARPMMIENLADALRSVDVEKWALVFMQNERLPLLHSGSRIFNDLSVSGGGDTGEQMEGTLKALKSFLNDCDRKIRLGTDMAVHIRDLRSLFIGAGATFHLFLSDAKGEMLDSDFLRWFPVFSSWESALRGIAKDTGGDVQDTTRLKEALEKAASQPDIFYVLTYKPGTPDTGKPKLKVEVSRPGLKVVYARKLKPREIRPLKLSEPVWKEGVLKFNISDYLQETAESGAVAGDVHVNVSSENLSGEPLEFEKVLHPEEESAAVEMKINFPEPGDYILTVAVTDRLSGNSARNYTRVSIAPPEPEPEEPLDPKLKALLEKAATYCGKLQKAAFRFTCTEVVEETVLERNPLNKRVEPVESRWHYDYQVVVEKEEVAEQRRLVRRNKKKVDQPDAKLETRFKAHYSVFLPVTLLGEHNRGNYRYKLLDTERLKKRHCAMIEVMPRLEGEGPMARGNVWVDVENGSVLKIVMDPRGVEGSAALEAAAKKMSAKLDLKVEHWYLEERKGLRFPSSTEFSESYLFDREVKEREKELIRSLRTYGARGPAVKFGYRKVEFYRLTQAYKNYRYFEVDTKVKVAERK